MAHLQCLNTDQGGPAVCFSKKGSIRMRDPTGDWGRMYYGRRRRRKFVIAFASIILVAFLLSILGADLQVFR
jgi:hypothetical protein